MSRTIPRLLLLPLPLLSGNTKLPLVAVLAAVKDVVMPPPAVALLVVVIVVVISTLAGDGDATTGICKVACGGSGDGRVGHDHHIC